MRGRFFRNLIKNFHLLPALSIAHTFGLVADVAAVVVKVVYLFFYIPVVVVVCPICSFSLSAVVFPCEMNVCD